LNHCQNRILGHISRYCGPYFRFGPAAGLIQKNLVILLSIFFS
jgi:hypothetical protein